MFMYTRESSMSSSLLWWLWLLVVEVATFIVGGIFYVFCSGNCGSDKDNISNTDYYRILHPSVLWSFVSLVCLVLVGNFGKHTISLSNWCQQEYLSYICLWWSNFQIIKSIIVIPATSVRLAIRTTITKSTPLPSSQPQQPWYPPSPSSLR